MKKYLVTLSMMAMSFSLYSQESIKDIEKEIAYLAKILLEKSGTESYTLSQERKYQPVIGACFAIKPFGVILTCITPDLDPQKKGMKTGDIITKINDINFDNDDSAVNKKLFSKMIDGLKTGEILSIEYTNKAKQKKNVNITVAEVAYPGFTLQVRQ